MRLGNALGAAMAGGVIFLAARAEAQPAPPAAPEPPLPPVSEARPPVPEAPEPAPVPWQHHLELGGGLAVAEVPATVDGLGQRTPTRFMPAPGFHVDLSWQILRYLRFTGYVAEHDHTILFAPGSLGLSGAIDAPPAHFYSFGARVSPTLPLGSRVRLWITGGVGFGRVEYGRFTFTEPGMSSSTLRERAESFFEIPLGLGGAVEIIPRWLSLHIELTGSFVPSQFGDALEMGQFIDSRGLMAPLPPMPKLDAVFVQTIGLSLHL